MIIWKWDFKWQCFRRMFFSQIPRIQSNTVECPTNSIFVHFPSSHLQIRPNFSPRNEWVLNFIPTKEYSCSFIWFMRISCLSQICSWIMMLPFSNNRSDNTDGDTAFIGDLLISQFHDYDGQLLDTELLENERVSSFTFAFVKIFACANQNPIVNQISHKPFQVSIFAHGILWLHSRNLQMNKLNRIQFLNWKFYCFIHIFWICPKFLHATNMSSLGMCIYTNRM